MFFSEVPALEPDVPVQFRQEGLLYHALPTGDSQNTTPLWPKNYSWPVADDSLTDSFLEYQPGFTNSSILAEYQLKHLAYDFATGETQNIERRINALRKLSERDPEYLNNTGALLARQGRYDDAKTFFDRALACDPDNKTVRGNLDKLRVRMEPGQ